MKTFFVTSSIFVFIFCMFAYCLFLDYEPGAIKSSDFPVSDSIMADSNTAKRWIEFWKPKNVLDNCDTSNSKIKKIKNKGSKLE